MSDSINVRLIKEIKSLKMEIHSNKKGEKFATLRFGRSKEVVAKYFKGYYYLHLQTLFKVGQPSFSLGTDEFEEFLRLTPDIK